MSNPFPSIRSLSSVTARRGALLTALVLVGVGAGLPALAAAEDITLEDLAWLAGHWADERRGMLMEEAWLPPAGGLMLGVHRDVPPGKSARFEYLRIEQTGDGILYKASPSGRPPTPFRLVEVGEQRAVFENPEHDFPQRITYWRTEATLHARVETLEGGGRLEWTWELRP